MRDKGYDQLPVATPTGSRLVGLVTLGNLLSYISRGRAVQSTPVSEVMFDFRKLEEVKVDERDGSALAGGAPIAAKDAASRARRPSTKGKTRPFVEITRDTPLSALSRFFEWNSAAVVTDKDEQGHMKPVAVVTKVDLLSWMIKQQQI